MMKFLSLFKIAGCGFVMGIADLLPGISGGTIAFILGIWERLILSIRDVGKGLLFFKNKREREPLFLALQFLLPLLVGITLALFLFTTTMDFLLNQPLTRCFLYSFFMGLILASSFLCLRKIKRISRNLCVVFIFFVALGFSLTYVKPPQESGPLYHVPLEHLPFMQGFEKGTNIDLEKGLLTHVDESALLMMLSKGVLVPSHEVFDAEDGSLVPLSLIQEKGENVRMDGWIIFCGAAAISAMLLPGISGSYLLVVLGMYSEVIGNVADFILSIKRGSFDHNSFFFLAQFALGVLFGASLFSKLISILFERYHDFAMSALAGFVLGTIRTVWPFWTFSYVIDPIKIEKGPRLIAEAPFFPLTEGFSLFLSFSIAFLGFILVWAMEFLAHKKKIKLSGIVNFF